MRNRILIAGLLNAALFIAASESVAQQPPPPAAIEGYPPVSIPPGGSGSVRPAMQFDEAPLPPPRRIWACADFLMYWMKDQPLPPLVTAGSPVDMFPATIGQPGTQVLYGGRGAELGTLLGLRLTAGMALTPDGIWTLEGSWFSFGQGGEDFAIQGNNQGLPIFGRPFVNALSGFENVELNANGDFTGRTDIAVRSRFQSWEINVAANTLFDGGGTRWEILGGFRALDLSESVDIQDILVDSGTPSLPFMGMTLPAGSALQIRDYFRTTNHFYGPQVGTRFIVDSGRFTYSAAVKLAMGVNQRFAVVDGSTTAYAMGTSFTTPGGVLALPTNMGRHVENVFSVAPEVQLNLGWRVTDYCKLTMGYNFLYWTGVSRPGNVMNRTLDPRQMPSDQDYNPLAIVREPSFLFRSSDFWIQGISLGVEFSY